MQTFSRFRKEVREYFQILSPEFPPFLEKYLNTSALSRLNGVGLNCGTDYSGFYRNRFFYSRLEHSVGTALILWHFTKDPAQTVAGLLHDLSTPAFSHVVDFMLGDAAIQEATELDNGRMIADSPELRRRLEADGLALSQVDDYHRYPLADNPSPRLSADRMEYTFSNLYSMTEDGWTLPEIAAVYQDIGILAGEDGTPEFGFHSIRAAEAFIKRSSLFGILTQRCENKITLQLLSDLLKRAIERSVIRQEDLYSLSEQEILLRISQEKTLGEAVKFLKHTKKLNRGEAPPPGLYAVRVHAKRRYINPLVQADGGVLRCGKASPQAAALLAEVRDFTDAPCCWLDMPAF